jgi:hypothetical protein
VAQAPAVAAAVLVLLMESKELLVEVEFQVALVVLQVLQAHWPA